MELTTEKQMTLDALKEGLSGCKEVLTNIVNSDNESSKSYNQIVGKELDNNAGRGTQFNDLAKQVLSDCGKILDHPNLSPENYTEVMNNEIEVLKMVNEHDKDDRNFEKELEVKANAKDTEKRKFHWDIIKGISYTIIGIAGIVYEMKNNDDLPFPKNLLEK